MKKLVSLFLLLTIATPALPMQRAKQLINKYSKPALQITAGVAALGLAAYGACKYGTVAIASEFADRYASAYPNIIVYGKNCSVVMKDNQQYHGEPCIHIGDKNRKNHIDKLVLNGKTFTDIIGNHIIVTNSAIVVDGKPLFEKPKPQQPVAPTNQQIRDSIITNPYVIGGSAVIGSLLITHGILNFKRAYRRP